MCKKKRYPTELDAKIALTSCYYANHIKGKSKRKECRYYYCDKCKGYHLTSEREWNDFNRANGD